MEPFELETPLLNEKQVAEHLHVSIPTLRRWRQQRTGPPYFKLGSMVRYSPVALAVWVRKAEVGQQYAREI